MKKILIGFLVLVLVGLIGLLIFNNGDKGGNLIELNYKEVSEKVSNKDNFILVVSQSTCSHCATYKPKLMEITQEYGIDVYYINYDLEKSEKQKEFLDKFNLSGATPTTMFIREGKEVSLLSRIEGDFSKSKVVTQFKKMGFIEE